MSDSVHPRSGVPRSRVLIGIVAVALLLALGVYAGLRSPWGTKHAQVKQGVAMRASNESDDVMFDADDGTQIDFGADHIWWRSGSQRGDANPPCLRRPLAKADVQVGLMWIADPDGGGHQQAVWVKCL